MDNNLFFNIKKIKERKKKNNNNKINNKFCLFAPK